MFEPAGRRTARMDAATAGVERSAAQVDIATRDVLREVAIAFYRTVHADRRIELLAAAESLATTIYQSADRRYRAGDIAVLDVNLARASLARVRSEREAAAADRIRAVSGLRQLLQVDAGVRVEADLAALPAIDRATIPDAATERPEIRELEALVREAEADARFAETFRRPEFGLGASFKKEEGDRAIGGVVKLTLPMFATGRYQREESLARVSRLRAELEARRMLIRVEVDASIEAYTRRRDAVQLLTKEALPGLDENEQLTARSFDAGQIGLPDLLLIRRELLDIRFTYLDALVEAAIARVELDAILGVLR
jgi:cobalt-zinc-cadmium efflux system outer membrane protein